MTTKQTEFPIGSRVFYQKKGYLTGELQYGTVVECPARFQYTDEENMCWAKWDHTDRVSWMPINRLTLVDQDVGDLEDDF